MELEEGGAGGACGAPAGDAKKTFCPGWYYQPGQKGVFCPGCQTRDKRVPPFVPAWRSRLGNRDKKGFPTGTNQDFCSSVQEPYYLLLEIVREAAVSFVRSFLFRLV